MGMPSNFSPLFSKIYNSPKIRFESLSHVAKCVRLLTNRARAIFALVVIFQIFTAILDLLGLALIINLITGLQIQGRETTVSTTSIFPFITKINSLSDSSNVILLVVIVFIFKGLAAMILHTLNVNLLGKETNRLVKSITNELIEHRSTKYKKLTSQDMAFSVFNATEIIFKDTLLPFTVILSDTILVFLIAFNLYLTIPVLFIPCAIYFGGIFFILWKTERKKTKNSYKVQLEAEILSRSYVVELIGSLRELFVSNTTGFFINKITEQRKRGIAAGAEIAIAQLRPKYVYEMALFGGIGIMALTAQFTNNASATLIYMSMFVISASRMIPSMLRIQFYVSTFRRSKEQSARIFDVLNVGKMVSNTDISQTLPIDDMEANKVFSPTVKVSNLVFSYDENFNRPVIDNLSLQINPGEVIAIVGPSGAGKSTFIDLLLGFVEPTSGSVQISGSLPKDAFSKWPGRVSYVPQDIAIFNASLFENIALGCSSDDLSARDKVQSLLLGVGLGEFVEGLELGIDSNLGEMGSKLSGGQIQKIGIARALFSDPQILIFDESTSSLDSESENEIMNLLLSLRKEKTLIFVAHRLSTVKTANRIIYLNKGVIEGEGDFSALRKKVPDFDKQVKLLDLSSQ